MSRVRIKTRPNYYKIIGEIMRSAEVGEQLLGIARPVYEQIRRDPNERYVSGLSMRLRNVGKRRGRAKVRISTIPVLSVRVEAKRGTMARAVSGAGH